MILTQASVFAPDPANRGDAALLACALACKTWPAPKLAAWRASPEFIRVGVLSCANADEYGGMARLHSAIASCFADFDRSYEAEDGRDGQASSDPTKEEAAVEMPNLAARPGYGYRLCHRCRGKKVVRGERCVCALPVDGRPGYELFVIPLEAK